MTDFLKSVLDRPFGRYALAVAAVAAALLLRLLLVQAFGMAMPLFITFYPAIMLVAVLAGLWPGIFATALTVLAVDYTILPPTGHLSIANLSDFVALAIFAAMGIFISLLAEQNRRNHRSISAYKAEQARHERDVLYHGLFDSMDEGFCVIEVLFDAEDKPLDYRFLEINAAFERQTGLHDAVGKRMLELVPSIESKGVEICGRVALTGEASHFFSERKAWNRHFEASAYRVGAPELRHVAVVFSDITERMRAEEALRKSETLYRGLFDSMDEGFCIIEMIFDAEGKPVDYRFLEINAAFESQTGMHDAVGKRMREIAPSHEEFWFDTYGAIALSGEPAQFIHKAEALNRFYDIRAYRVGEPDQRHVAVVFSDISVRMREETHIRQLNRVYSVLSGINETIVREKDTEKLLVAACRIAVEKGQFLMAWIGMADSETHVLQPVAASGNTGDYLDRVHLDLKDPYRAAGPSVQCFFSGEHFACNSIENDPRLAPWREDALTMGYRSFASLPLKVDAEPVGIFNLYAGEPEFFVGDEFALLDEMAMDISFALEVNLHEKDRRKNEEELRWRTAFFEAQVDSAQDGVLVVDGKGKKILQNQRLNALLKLPLNVFEKPGFCRADSVPHRMGEEP